jgi:hypothetical protein
MRSVFFYGRAETHSLLTLPLQATALREAIREYEANKWKVIGQKVGKPAKVLLPVERLGGQELTVYQACEHYAREHFRNV